MKQYRFYGKVTAVRLSHKGDYAYVTVRLAPYDRYEVVPVLWSVVSEQGIGIGSILAFDMSTLFTDDSIQREGYDGYGVIWNMDS